MKVHLISIIMLFGLVAHANQVPTEQQVREEIQNAQAVIRTKTTALNQAEQDLKSKTDALNQLRKKWSAIKLTIKQYQERLNSTNNSIESAVAQATRQLKRYEDKLQRQQQNGASSAEITDTQNYIRAYRNMRDSQLQRSGLLTLKQGYERNIAREEAKLEALKTQLTSAIKATHTAEQAVNNTQLELADAQLALAEVLLKAGEKLAHVAPPHLQNVTVKKGRSIMYEAKWADYTEIIDKQIELVKKGIEVQKQHLADHKKMIDILIEDLTAQNKLAQEKMDAYVAEVNGWGIAKMIMADLLDAGISIARNFKEMGPYAFAFEAVWRVGLAATGQGTVDWDVTKMPMTTNPPTDYAAVATTYGKANLIDQTKSLILDAVKVAVASDNFGIPGSGVTFGKGNGGFTPDLKSFKGIKNSLGSFRSLVNEGKFWVVAEKELLEKWISPVGGDGKVIKNFFNTLKNNPRRFVQEIKGSFNKQRIKGGLLDVVQSTAIQGLKDWLDQDRMDIWMEYIIADAKRESLRQGLTAAGDQRRKNQVTLQALGKALEDLIKEKEEEALKPKRYLKTLKDKELTGTGEFTVILDFSGDIKLNSVELAGKLIEGEAKDNIWTGTFDLTDMVETDYAKLIVKGEGAITRKGLDDPITKAIYRATTKSWAGYERKPDMYHEIKLKPIKPGTSILLLFDTSGSMNDNNRMAKAIQAGQELLSSEELEAGDQIAVMTFSGCYGAAVAGAFTSNFDEVSQRISSLRASGSTPLALAMEQASVYLESAARNENRRLIVLTDGEESCEGNEYLSLERINAFQQQFQKIAVR